MRIRNAFIKKDGITQFSFSHEKSNIDLSIIGTKVMFSHSKIIMLVLRFVA